MREITLVRLARCCAVYRKVSLPRVGFLCANDGKFINRIAKDGTCALRTASRAMLWFSGHWPEDLEWPPDIPRPEPSSDLDAEA